MMDRRTLSVVVALSTFFVACSIGGQSQLQRPLEVVFERGFDRHKVAIISRGEIIFEDTLSTLESIGYAGYAEICQRNQKCSFGIIVNDSLLRSVEIDTREWYAVTVNLRGDSTLHLDMLDYDPIYD